MDRPKGPNVFPFCLLPLTGTHKALVPSTKSQASAGEGGDRGPGEKMGPSTL